MGANECRKQVPGLSKPSAAGSGAASLQALLTDVCCKAFAAVFQASGNDMDKIRDV